MDFQAAKAFILHKLREELPRNLTYHGLHHTLDVCQSAKEIAQAEQVGREGSKSGLLINSSSY